MFETAVQVALLFLATYAVIGALFAFAFHCSGIRRVDHGVPGAGWRFRLLITPGLMGLWPLLALKWRRAARGGAFAGGSDAPVSARQLRSLHHLWWKLLAVLVPLLIAAALYWRPDAALATTPKLPTPLQPRRNLKPFGRRL